MFGLSYTCRPTPADRLCVQSWGLVILTVGGGKRRCCLVSETCLPNEDGIGYRVLKKARDCWARWVLGGVDFNNHLNDGYFDTINLVLMCHMLLVIFQYICFYMLLSFQLSDMLKQWSAPLMLEQL